jgi:hypothetical protein
LFQVEVVAVTSLVGEAGQEVIFLEHKQGFLLEQHGQL